MGLLGYERRIERAVGVPGAALGRLEGGLESGGAKRAKWLSFSFTRADCSVNWRGDANVRVSPQLFRS